MRAVLFSLFSNNRDDNDNVRNFSNIPTTTVQTHSQTYSTTSSSITNPSQSLITSLNTSSYSSQSPPPQQFEPPLSSIKSSINPPLSTLQLTRLEEALTVPIASTQTLRDLLWLGVPAEARPELRAILWKLLFGYVPLAQSGREATARRKEAEYSDLRNRYFNSDGSFRSDGDSKTLKQIKVDLVRTNPSGFTSVFTSSIIQSLMHRVLLIWAIRNPASGYVQGLNDVLVPLVLVFLKEELHTNDLDEVKIQSLKDSQILVIEAQCYWCLMRLLSYIQDNFVFGQPGIVRMVRSMEKIVQRVDNALFNHLKTEGIELLQICFRWMNCLLIRELPLAIVIRLWDTYIAEGPSGFSDFHTYVCSVFLVYWSSRLRSMDFQHILLFLQSVPTSNWTYTEVESLVAEAFVLKSLFHSSPRHLCR